MRVAVGVTIDAPPDVVWRFVERIERHVDWMADAEAICFDGPRTRGVGTVFDCVTKVGPFRLTDRMTVVEWEPERSLGIRHRGVVTGHGRFTLRPRRGRRPGRVGLAGLAGRAGRAGRRTRFRWEERLTFPWWAGGPVGALAAKPVLTAIWRRNLRRLKSMVEGT